MLHRALFALTMLACGAAFAGDEPDCDAKTERSYIRALEAQQRRRGPDHPDVDAAFDDLSEFYSSCLRYADAEKLIGRLLAAREKALGPRHPRVAGALTYLAHLQLRQNRLADAEHSALRAAEIYQHALGPSDPKVAMAAGMIATILMLQDRHAEAEIQARRAFEIFENAFGPDHPEVADALSNLAGISYARGNLYEAEQQYRQVLAIRGRSGNPTIADDAETLSALAQVYESQGRDEDARGLYVSAIAILEKQHGADHPEMTIALSGLGRTLEVLGKPAEAEKFYRRALTITERTSGLADPETAGPLNDLAVTLFAQQRYAEAETLYQRSLALEITARGAEHPGITAVLTNLAELYQAQQRDTEAESLYRRAIAVLERAFGPDHPELAARMTYLAGLYRSQARIDEALQHARRASAILAAKYTQRKREPQRAVLSELRTGAWQYEQHIAILADLAETAPGSGSEAALESFEIAQMARVSDTAEQVAIMAARHASGDDSLAKLARARQDALLRLEQAERAFVDSVSGAAGDRNKAKEAELHLAEREIRAEIARLDEDLDREFPRYWELTSRKPLPLRQAQKFLAPTEALLVFLVSGSHSYAWAVRRNEEKFVRLAISRDELTKLVSKLRTRLDLGAPDAGRMLERPFDLATSHELYRRLFGPLEPQLTGVQQLILVLDGALQSLPPAVLVTDLPARAVQSVEDHASVEWLVKKYSITVLPAVSSLRVLRQFASPPASREPFGGFGDPLLDGSGPGTRVRALYARGAVADAGEVRKLERLPESATELRAIAVALKASPGAVRLGSEATERAVKEADLSRYRNLAFATHGLMAGEFRGLAEPALVLTPPEKGSELDDGLLTASEISRLKLDADWVVLSACNTAAPDGTPGAEGLSGLARAFFYAGARSLLVSHWAVASDATVALTTKMFQESARGTPKAEALRRSMLALMQTPGKPHYAHPAFWAPFVLVGEGGAGAGR